MVRGKFQVTKRSLMLSSSTSVEITLTAVSNDGTPENERFHKYTPSGSIIMYVDNPAASDQLALGKYFYVDFTETT